MSYRMPNCTILRAEYASAGEGGGKVSENNERGSYSIAAGVAIGLAIGVAVGLAFDNLALWLSIGVALGLAIGVAVSDQTEDPPPRPDEPSGEDQARS